MMIPLGDGEAALLRFGRAGAPPLLFAHANGFCASAYRQMFEAMGERFDIFAADLRGFGRSRLPADPARHRSMDVFGADLARLIDALAPHAGRHASWTLAGHSLGAVSAALAAVGRTDIVALRLIEPVATPRWLSLLAGAPFWPLFSPAMPLVRAARARRAVFPDRAFVRGRYAGKPLFSTWAAGVLEDYLEDGLREIDDGVELSCAPAWEAATFAGQAQDFWKAAAVAPAPLRVLVARDASSTTPPAAQRRLRRLGAVIERVDGLTHLMPFEDPARAAAFLAAD